jgi:hypothetical protein
MHMIAYIQQNMHASHLFPGHGKSDSVDEKQHITVIVQ